MISIPDTPCPLSEEDEVELSELHDPLQTCDDYGISMYLNVVEFVSMKIAP